ncbi:terminase small subunit [Nitrospina gracilis]|uniref:terminase small subunit n=1 Tax=Nitrospina gracilis TaxID=35801 RepID=UPI001F49103E|nr:terminase small subunit [Nitrospina gracilis]MCF8719375.1 phage terminase small subunit [Nitrospina gracilis Nb-211]
MKNKGLTAKQKRFVEEYLIDLNATQAAIRAGYSRKTANVQGSQNLTKLSIHTEIQRGLYERSKRLEARRERLLNELASIAFTNISDVCSWGPDGIKLIPMEELTPEQKVGISQITFSFDKNAQVTGVKMHNKLRALHLLAKHMGIYPKNRKRP